MSDICRHCGWCRSLHLPDWFKATCRRFEMRPQDYSKAVR